MTANPAVAQPTVVSQPLNATPEHRRLTGFFNLLRNENTLWWRTRRWLVNTITWVAILDGILVIMLGASSGETVPGTIDLPFEGTIVFLTLMLVALAIGAVIIGQGAIIDEKQSGTAAWILSKPASRAAFILAKLIAHSLGLLVTGILIPGAIAFVVLTAIGGSFAISNLVAALGIALLNVVFYLALTMMLGTLSNGRGAAIGIPLAFLLSYQLFLGLAPWLATITPWGFLTSATGRTPSIALVALGQSGLPLMPIVATAIWCVLFTAVALWRFGREEF
jgi:ABC-2 type transport system permease protein